MRDSKISIAYLGAGMQRRIKEKWDKKYIHPCAHQDATGPDLPPANTEKIRHPDLYTNAEAYHRMVKIYKKKSIFLLDDCPVVVFKQKKMDTVSRVGNGI